MSMINTGPASAPPPLPATQVSLRRQLIFWSCALLVFIALLWLLNDVLLPFVAGMVLAYLLDPLVKRLQRLGLSRPIASVVIVAIMIILLALALILILPVLGEQSPISSRKIPQYFDRVRQIAQEQSQGWLGRMVGDKLPDAQKQLGGVASTAAGWIAGFLTSLWSGGKALISVISLLVITPIVAFYMLLDWERMIAKVDSWIPVPYRDTVRGLAREMDAAISGFVRGQALVCLILGHFLFHRAYFARREFRVADRHHRGDPRVCALYRDADRLPARGRRRALRNSGRTGPCRPLRLASSSPANSSRATSCSRFLVGKEIGLHPVWLMFALIAFGVLFGFVGLLVAVPVAAAIGVLVRFLLRQYLASPYYTGAQ